MLVSTATFGQDCNDPCFAEYNATATSTVDCLTPITALTACDDGDPCTIDDMVILGGDGTTECQSCAGTVIGPPMPVLVCPTAPLEHCGPVHDGMFADGNTATQAMGTEAIPIIGGSTPTVVSATGIIDPATLTIGTYSFTLNYESPTGCLGTPVTCTFMVLNTKNSDAGMY